MVLLAALGVVVSLRLLALVVARPQRGVLLLVALLPLDGLLLVLPGGSAVAAWKEAMVVLVLGATLVAPASARRAAGERVPSWVGVVVAYLALGVCAAVLTGGVVGLWGFKVGYFYMLVPLILWRCPLSREDRDRLVTILMAAGLLTALVGLAQQGVGPDRLAALGYDYNTTIRYAGGLLRSFSTFTQPFSFGLFVCMTLLVCLPVALSDPRRLRNTLFLAGTPLLALGLASSVVRGAFLSLAVGLALLAFLRYRNLLHGLLPVLVLLALLPTSVLSAYFSTSSLGQRASGWTEIAGQVVSAPWGNGLGITGAAAEKALEVGASTDDVLMVDGQEYQPDNQFVKAAIELGVIGLWLLVLVLAAALVAASRAARRADLDERTADRALSEGIAAALVGSAAAFLVSTYLEVFPLDFYFWLLLGVLLCLDRPSNSTPLPSDPVAAASRPTSGSSSAR